MPVVSHILEFETISVDFAGTTYTYKMPFLINAPKEPQVPQPVESAEDKPPKAQKLYREVLAFDLETTKKEVIKKRSFCQL